MLPGRGDPAAASAAAWAEGESGGARAARRGRSGPAGDPRGCEVVPESKGEEVGREPLNPTASLLLFVGLWRLKRARGGILGCIFPCRDSKVLLSSTRCLFELLMVSPRVALGEGAA